MNGPVFSKERLDMVRAKVVAYKGALFGRRLAKEIITQDVPDLLTSLSKSQDEISKQQREIHALNRELDRSSERTRHNQKRRW